MANETEPRALGAALAAPAFVTRGHGVAMHAADRHVERWAPEASAGRVRSMRSLGFVDRLVAPWIETAQRSASLRLFNQYASTGPGERAPGAVSWVFPRPWYQDELDWMAAARCTSSQAEAARQVAPSLLTTRGTYVAPASAAAPAAVAAPPVAMPAALYEHVAPSLSLAASRPAAIPGTGFGGEALPRSEAYSSLVPLAAIQAAELMTRAIAPLVAPRGAAASLGAAAPALGTAAMTPGLRSVLTSILARASVAQGEMPATRIAALAPALETPPAPRPSAPAAAGAGEPLAASAVEVAEQYAAQQAQVAELQRIARQSMQRELASRAPAAEARAAVPASPAQEAAARAAAAQVGETAAARAAAQAADAAATAELRAAAERAEAELRRRAAGPAGEAQRAADAARAAEIERARSALAQGTSGTPAEDQRMADAARAAAAEHARIEERVAQRLAERASAQRLHEQARAEAAAHARAGAEQARRSTAPGASGEGVAPVAPPRAPAEVTAAIAGLPPELAAMLGSVVAQRPERAMQAISELNETLRTVELLARSSAAGAAFEVTRGPRLVMPAGLGGLVSAVDRAQSIAERPALLGGRRPLAPLPQLIAPGQAQELPARGAPGMAREVRVPALPWLSAEPRPQAIAPTTALGATAAAAPAALSHVAWADRWLARFAGATPQSLDMITAAGAAAPATRMRALVDAAPGAVFVAPDFLRGDLAADTMVGGRSAAPTAIAPATGAESIGAPAASRPAVPERTAAPAAEIPGMRRIDQPSDVVRYDDESETPDDVLAAIAAAAARGRASRPVAPAPAPAPAPAAPAAAATTAARPVLADLVAHAAPSAPGAGLSAQLASSPFAPALRHVVTLPSAPSFDVRSLFGADLGATYLAGLIGPASRELAIGAQSAPIWAAWSEAPGPLLAADRTDRPDRIDHIDRIVPGFDAAYVAPEAPLARDAAELDGAEAGRHRVAPAEAALAAATAATGPAAGTTAFAERLGALTTLRTALLSWELAAGEAGAPGQAGAPQLVPGSFAAAPSLVPPALASYREAVAASAGAARRMVEAMSLPMLGESAAELPSTWSAPGMVAERAHTWSVAQERSASDLALDFVTPELVLAARVYGLGPAEAAQAARLAIVGPGQLGAMASTVDRTFVEAIAIGRDARLEAERHQRGSAATAGARPVRGGPAGAPADLVAPPGPALPGEPAAAAAPGEIRAAITTAFPTSDGAIAAAIAPTRHAAAQPASSGAAFGVDRRAPRGAFLWPSATVAALGMNAAGSDGQLSMSVAALELLAAQVVAELGTFTALSDAHAATLGIAGGEQAAPGADRAAPGQADRGSSARAALVGTSPAAPAGGRDAAPAAPGAEPAEADVLGAAAALVPASRRARFEALYIALAQAPAGLHWSPAARAARALALAGRSEDGPITARQRAAAAWDVLPVVYGGDRGDAASAGAVAAGAAAASATTEAVLASTASASASAAIAQAMASHVAPSWLGGPRTSAPAGGARGAARAARSGARDLVAADLGDAGTGERGQVHVTGPGLSGLVSRAGEALGSYIVPAAPPSPPRERPAELTSVGAVLRPPTAAPEYVQTGTRSGGRYGGGEVEIPPWFEAAARKMLAERGDGDGISLAELTLVTAAPAGQVAASTRSAPSAAPPSPGAAASAQQPNGAAPQIDVEKLANEVYRNILVLMDVARARNGDPHL